MNDYSAIFEAAAKQNGIDPHLLKAVAYTESRYNPNADSGQAKGIMQFTPATAKAMGVDPNNPESAIHGAAKLLRQNLDASNGDQATALKMYHGGTDTKNWGDKTHAYPETVQKHHAQIVKANIEQNDPVYKMFQTGKIEKSSLAQEEPKGDMNDPIYRMFMSGGKDLPPLKEPEKPGWTGDKPITPEQLSSGINDTATGLIGGAAHVATGALGSVVAGVGGWARHATGEPVKNTQQWMHDIQQQFTYSGEEGSPQRKTSDAIDKVGSVLLMPGEKANEYLTEAGHPIAGNIAQAANNLAALWLPVKSGKASPIEAGAEGSARSGGAAATRFTERAITEGVTPEVIAEIKKAEDAGQLNELAAERYIEAHSLPHPVDITAGMANGDVNLLSWEQNNRGAHPKLANAFNSHNGQLIKNIETIADEAAPDIYATNHVENGAALIDAYKAKDSLLKQDISAKYKALEEANGGQFPVSGADFVKAADAELAKKMKGRYVPAEIKADMADLRNGGAMTFEQFENMRTNLAADIRKAERSGDGNAAYAISIVRDALESLPMEGAAAELKGLADSARSAAKARFDLLKKDPAYKAAVDETTKADDFINKHVINGKVEHVKAMRENLANDELAAQTIAAGVVNYLKSKAGIHDGAGNFTQAGFNKALRQIEPKLLDLIEAKHAENLRKLGNVARYTQEQPSGSYVNNSNTLVGGLAESAKNMAFHGADRLTMGGASILREHAKNKEVQAKVNKSLKPGSAVWLRDIAR